MKIAVYGDSFTVEFDQTRQWAWFNLLADKLNGRVESDHMLDSSYGIAGASTFYSYKKFLETYHRYDYVFFVAGDPYRYTKPIQRNNGLFFISNLPTVEFHINEPTTASHFKDHLTKLKNWFEVADSEYQEIAQHLMLDDVKNKMKGNALILPANDKSFNEQQKLSYGMGDFTMTDYCRTIWDNLKLPAGKHLNERNDRICCHFTEEANRRLTDMLFHFIQNPETTTLNLPKDLNHQNPWNHYYYE